MTIWKRGRQGQSAPGATIPLDGQRLGNPRSWPLVKLAPFVHLRNSCWRVAHHTNNQISSIFSSAPRRPPTSLTAAGWNSRLKLRATQMTGKDTFFLWMSPLQIFPNTCPTMAPVVFTCHQTDSNSRTICCPPRLFCLSIPPHSAVHRTNYDLI